jgi:hypothetical protein
MPSCTLVPDGTKNTIDAVRGINSASYGMDDRVMAERSQYVPSTMGSSVSGQYEARIGRLEHVRSLLDKTGTCMYRHASIHVASSSWPSPSL